VTLADWLAARTPEPPAPLSARLRESLDGALDERASRAYDALLHAAESMLGELLALDCAMRDRALDLLAVDAMVTYAFEAACEEPATLAARATVAMRDIAVLAAPTLRA
jgi:hypothetical protein